MKLFDYTWFSDFHGSIEELKSIAMKEDWDYKKNPIGKNPILENYIKHTFVKLYEEKKVLEQNGYSVFNTGLVTDYQEEIFAFSQYNKRQSSQFQYIKLKHPFCQKNVQFGTIPILFIIIHFGIKDSLPFYQKIFNSGLCSICG